MRTTISSISIIFEKSGIGTPSQPSRGLAWGACAGGASGERIATVHLRVGGCRRCSDPSSTLSPQERLAHILAVTEREDLEPFEHLDLLYVVVLNQIPKASCSEVLRILRQIHMPGTGYSNITDTLLAMKGWLGPWSIFRRHEKMVLGSNGPRWPGTRPSLSCSTADDKTLG